MHSTKVSNLPQTKSGDYFRTMHLRGAPAVHLNEPTWIIDGFNEFTDFLFALVIFLGSTQPWPFKSWKWINFFGSNKWMSCKYNSNAKPNPGQNHSSFHLLAHSNAGLVFLFIIIYILLYLSVITELPWCILLFTPKPLCDASFCLHQ